MNIDLIDLYDALGDNISFDEIIGEVTLKENSIIWKYDANDIDCDFDEEDDIISPTIRDSKLFDIYEMDVEIVYDILDMYSLWDYWTITDPIIEDGVISFEIIKK